MLQSPECKCWTYLQLCGRQVHHQMKGQRSCFIGSTVWTFYRYISEACVTNIDDSNKQDDYWAWRFWDTLIQLHWTHGTGHKNQHLDSLVSTIFGLSAAEWLCLNLVSCYVWGGVTTFSIDTTDCKQTRRYKSKFLIYVRYWYVSSTVCSEMPRFCQGGHVSEGGTGVTVSMCAIEIVWYRAFWYSVSLLSWQIKGFNMSVN